MVKRDYYIILGVSRSESSAGIHEAFRKLAKKHHPDRGGPAATETFQEIAKPMRFFPIQSSVRHTSKLFAGKKPFYHQSRWSREDVMEAISPSRWFQNQCRSSTISKQSARLSMRSLIGFYAEISAASG
jgi:hypothetical protein